MLEIQEKGEKSQGHVWMKCHHSGPVCDTQEVDFITISVLQLLVKFGWLQPSRKSPRYGCDSKMRSGWTYSNLKV